MLFCSPKHCTCGFQTLLSGCLIVLITALRELINIAMYRHLQKSVHYLLK